MTERGLGFRAAMMAVFAVQLASAVFFVGDILLSVLGIYMPPLSWEWRETLELFAALGLVLGLGMGALMLRHQIRARAAERDQLRRASGAFVAVLEERFRDWGLTPSERDVALFAIKGLSTAEIASLRGSQEGTVKAQTAAIYRKAGVSGRAQLLSQFIDDLIVMPQGDAPPVSEAAPSLAARCA